MTAPLVAVLLTVTAIAAVTIGRESRRQAINGARAVWAGQSDRALSLVIDPTRSLGSADYGRVAADAGSLDEVIRVAALAFMADLSESPAVELVTTDDVAAAAVLSDHYRKLIGVWTDAGEDVLTELGLMPAPGHSFESIAAGALAIADGIALRGRVDPAVLEPVVVGGREWNLAGLVVSAFIDGATVPVE